MSTAASASVAWSAWHFTATPEATKVFNESLSRFPGVKYKMVAFATQVVNGTNYAFLCEAAAPSHPQTDYIVVWHAHQPIQGEPHFTEIRAIEFMPNHIANGWQNWHSGMTPRAQTILTTATQQLHGVHYKGLAFTTQFNNGTNYEFLCEATLDIPGGVPYAVTLFVHQPIQGAPHITSIVKISPES